MKRTLAWLGMTMAALVTGAGGSPGDWVRQGNEEFEVGNYDEALRSYRKAAKELPDSAEIEFNQGAALYRKKDYTGAAARFAEAARLAAEPDLRAKAEYNLGGARFRQAEQLRESDPEGSIKASRQSVNHYGEALRLQPGRREAAENLELARRYLKALLEEQKQQPQGQQGQDGQDQQQGQQGQDQQQGQQGQDQQGQQGDQQQQPGASEQAQGKQPPQPGSSQDGKQAQAQDPKDAAHGNEEEKEKEKQAQDSAASREAKSGEQDRPEVDAAAQAILEEEKETKERRMRLPVRGMKPVDKDW